MEAADFATYLSSMIQSLRDYETQWNSQKALRNDMERGWLHHEWKTFKFMKIAYNMEHQWKESEIEPNKPIPAQLKALEAIAKREDHTFDDIIEFQQIYMDIVESQDKRNNLWTRKKTWYQARASILGIQTGLVHQTLQERANTVNATLGASPAVMGPSNAETFETMELADDSKGEKAKLNKQFTLLNSKVSDLECLARKHKLEADELKSAIRAMERVAEVSDQRCKKVTQSLEHVEKQLLQRKTAMKDMVVNQEYLENLTEKLTEELRQKETDLKKERSQHQETKDSIRQKLEMYQALQQKVFNLEAELEELKRNQESANTLALDMNSTTLQIIRDARKMRDRFEAEKAELMNENVLLKEEVNDLEQRCLKIQENAAQTEKSLEESQILEDELRLTAENMKEWAIYNKGMREQMMQKSDGSKQLSNTELTENYAELNSRVIKQQAEVYKLENILNKDREEMKKYLTMYQGIEQKVSDLEKEKSELKRTIDDLKKQVLTNSQLAVDLLSEKRRREYLEMEHKEREGQWRKRLDEWTNERAQWMNRFAEQLQANADVIAKHLEEGKRQAREIKDRLEAEKAEIMNENVALEKRVMDLEQRCLTIQKNASQTEKKLEESHILVDELRVTVENMKEWANYNKGMIEQLKKKSDDSKELLNTGKTKDFAEKKQQVEVKKLKKILNEDMKELKEHLKESERRQEERQTEQFATFQRVMQRECEFAMRQKFNLEMGRELRRLRELLYESAQREADTLARIIEQSQTISELKQVTQNQNTRLDRADEKEVGLSLDKQE